MPDCVKKAILPAAGLGTRFLPATKASPKEMLPIVDKPMIQYSVEEARAFGIEEFIVITGKNKRAIEDHFDTAFKLEEALKRSGKKRLLEELNELTKLNIAYIRQGKALGLGHAIYCAAPFVKDEPFAVILSDDIIPPDETLLGDMIDLYAELNAPVLCVMTVPRDEIGRYGVIEGKEVKPGVFTVKSLIEKPRPEDAPSNLAVIGRYIITPDIFQILGGLSPGAGGEIQLTDALNILAKKRKVYAFHFKGRRYDAGDKLGFLTATVDFALENHQLKAGFREFLIERVGRLKA